MNAVLITEFLLLYLCPPLLIAAGVLPKVALMPLLWVGMLYAYVMMRRAGQRMPLGFSRDALGGLMLRWLLLGTLLALFVRLVFPQMFLSLPEQRPLLWLAILVLYPLFSAFAQEIIFRAFFVYRYERILTHPALFMLVNALLFAYIHIVFANLTALLLSFLGGLLFISTFLRTRSVTMSTIEHGLYGNLVFTLGIGPFFYHGA